MRAKINFVAESFASIYSSPGIAEQQSLYSEGESPFVHLPSFVERPVYIARQGEDFDENKLKNCYFFEITGIAENGSKIKNAKLYLFTDKGKKFEIRIQDVNVIIAILSAWNIPSDPLKRPTLYFTQEQREKLYQSQYYVLNPEKLKLFLSTSSRSFLKSNDNSHESQRQLIDFLSRVPDSYLASPLYTKLFDKQALEQLYSQYKTHYLGNDDIYFHHIQLAYHTREFAQCSKKLIVFSALLIASLAMFAFYVYTLPYACALSTFFIALNYLDLAAYFAVSLYCLREVMSKGLTAIKFYNQKKSALDFLDKENNLPLSPPGYSELSFQNADQENKLSHQSLRMSKEENLRNSLRTEAKRSIWESAYNFFHPFRKAEPVLLPSYSKVCS